MGSVFDVLCVRLAQKLGKRLKLEKTGTDGRILGECLWRIFPERRRLAVRNVQELLHLDESAATEIVRQSYHNTCRSALEIFLSNKVDPAFMHSKVTVADPEGWKTLCTDPRPSIYVTGHLGCWELLAGVMHCDIKKPCKQVVTRRHRKPAYQKAMTELRSKPDVEVVDHRRASTRVLQCLRQKGGAAFLVDHNTMRKEAVFLPFLGRVAAVNRGPALLAVRGKATVWPMCMIRQESGGYAIHVQPSLDTTELSGPIHERVEHTAKFYTQAMEAFVRRFPEQWMWIHKRWKTRPPNEHPPTS